MFSQTESYGILLLCDEEKPKFEVFDFSDEAMLVLVCSDRCTDCLQSDYCILDGSPFFA